jgi:hypothetical protein
MYAQMPTITYPSMPSKRKAEPRRLGQPIGNRLFKLRPPRAGLLLRRVSQLDNVDAMRRKVLDSGRSGDYVVWLKIDDERRRI